jgi:hypothetical protein
MLRSLDMVDYRTPKLNERSTPNLPTSLCRQHKGHWTDCRDIHHESSMVLGLRTTNRHAISPTSCPASSPHANC